MRKFYLLIILAIFHLSGFSQTVESPVQFLAVEKASETGTVTLIFKPGTKLTIKTTDGAIITARDYSLVEGALLINQEENIQLDQIASIKGKVYEDYGRKSLGGVIAVGSVPVGFFTVFLLAWGGWPIVPTAIPFIGAMVGGIRLMGARRFNALEKWTLLIVEQE
jgi:hypothetical protein